MHTRAVEQEKTELEAALQRTQQQHTLRMQQQLDALAPDAAGGGAHAGGCAGDEAALRAVVQEMQLAYQEAAEARIRGVEQQHALRMQQHTESIAHLQRQLDDLSAHGVLIQPAGDDVQVAYQEAADAGTRRMLTYADVC